MSTRSRGQMGRGHLCCSRMTSATLSARALTCVMSSRTSCCMLRTREPAHPRMERQAHRFAGALLIPAQALKDAWPRGRWDWNQMVRIKEHWGISIGAQLSRARDLGVLTADSYLSKMKYMSRMGWRRRELGPHRPPEKPDLLNQAIGLLEQSGTSLDTIAEEGNLLGAMSCSSGWCHAAATASGRRLVDAHSRPGRSRRATQTLIWKPALDSGQPLAATPQNRHESPRISSEHPDDEGRNP